MDSEKVRMDFAVLQDSAPRPVAYLDNACTTLKPNVVVEAVATYYANYPVCGDRSVHRMGRQVTAAVDGSRRALARHVGADDANVVFTRNATEAINMIANGVAWRAGDVVITTDKEHNSNFVPWVRLARARRVEHVVVATRQDGTLDMDAFAQAVEAAAGRVRLASLTHVSNVDGVQAPVAEAAKIVRDAGGSVLVDAAQSAAHQRVDLAALGADWIALSLHKMLGPSGVGALVGAPGAFDELEPHSLGGGTVDASAPGSYQLAAAPARFEAGLSNFASIVATAAGLSYLQSLGFEAIQAHDRQLNRRATRALQALDGVTVHGPAADDRSSILPFTVDGIDPHDVAVSLDEQADVAVRSGAHCVHSYFDARGISGTVRASFHAYNNLDDVDRMVAAVETICAGLHA